MGSIVYQGSQEQKNIQEYKHSFQKICRQTSSVSDVMKKMQHLSDVLEEQHIAIDDEGQLHLRIDVVQNKDETIYTFVDIAYYTAGLTKEDYWKLDKCVVSKKEKFFLPALDENSSNIELIKKTLKQFPTLKPLGEKYRKMKEIVLIAVANNGLALQYVDDSLKKDKEVVLAAIKQNIGALKYVDDSIKKDKEINETITILSASKYNYKKSKVEKNIKISDKSLVLQAVKKSGLALEYADDSLKKDREVVLAAIRRNAEALQYADASLKKDREIVLESVRKKGYMLKYADSSLRKDKEVVITAVSQNAWALKYADDSLKKDREVVLAAIQQNAKALQYADASLKKDREIVLESVRKKGYILKYADSSLRKDKEVVLAAVENYGDALEYADTSLKNDREIVLEAVKNDKYALEYAGDILKKDQDFLLTVSKQKQKYNNQNINKYHIPKQIFKKAIEIDLIKKGFKIDGDILKNREAMLYAVKISGLNLASVDESLKKDKEIVLAAVKNDGRALEYADDSLKKDRDIVLAAVQQTNIALVYADESLKSDQDILAIINETDNSKKQTSENGIEDKKSDKKGSQVSEKERIFEQINLNSFFHPEDEPKGLYIVNVQIDNKSKTYRLYCPKKMVRDISNNIYGETRNIEDEDNQVFFGKEVLRKIYEKVCDKRDGNLQTNTQKNIAIVQGLDSQGDGFLAIRDTPNGHLIGKLYNGDSVIVLAKEGRWYKVKRILDGLIGWSYGRWIKKVSKNMQKEEKSIGIIQGLDPQGDGFLAIRDKPKGRLLGKLYNADRVIILDRKGKWYKIKRISDGLIGWSYYKWIKKRDNFSSKEIKNQNVRLKKPGLSYNPYDKYHSYHILLRTKEKALKLLDILRYSQDRKKTFIQLAKKYSNGPSAGKGGNLGWARKGQFVPNFEKAIFLLNDNEILDEPIRTQFGWHIVFLVRGIYM